MSTKSAKGSSYIGNLLGGVANNVDFSKLLISDNGVYTDETFVFLSAPKSLPNIPIDCSITAPIGACIADYRPRESACAVNLRLSRSELQGVALRCGYYNKFLQPLQAPFPFCLLTFK